MLGVSEGVVVNGMSHEPEGTVGEGLVRECKDRTIGPGEIRGWVWLIPPLQPRGWYVPSLPVLHSSLLPFAHSIRSLQSLYQPYLPDCTQ